MRFFRKKKQQKRKVFGFLCDPDLALAVKMIAGRLETPIYPVAEHLLQLGAAQIVPTLQDERYKRELQQHLINEHLLAPTLDERNRYDQLAQAQAVKREKRRQNRLNAALELVQILEHGGVSRDRIKSVVKRLQAEARAQHTKGQTPTVSRD